MAAFQSLPGFREFYPEDLARRNHLFRLWRRTANAFGFSEYDAPVLEPLELYKAKSGDEIEGQLFSFVDKGGRAVALRPEMTPTACRLIGERAGSLKRPLKWYSVAEFYRYERMQKGRGRSFFQFNADIFDEPGPEAEIELIALLIGCFRAFGLTERDFYVRLSDRNLWFHYLGVLGLDESRSIALLGAIDKFERAGEDAFEPYTQKFGPLQNELKEAIHHFAAIKSLDDLKAVETLSMAKHFLSDEGRGRQSAVEFRGRIEQWGRLMSSLEAMGLKAFVQVDMGVVRGLAYYTGFVFEAFDRKGDLRALAGGGRYDRLVGKLGGPEMPAVGFAIGDMTFSLLLEQRGLLPQPVSAPDVYAVIGGEAERRAAFGDISELRAAGYRVEYALRATPFGKQFKAAAESGARLALIYGSDELSRGAVKIRDMAARTEREVPREEVQAAVRDFLSGGPEA